MIETINLPNKVKYIIKTLEASGFKAYAVGGCIRDSVMGKKPKDWDICTSALPEKTMEIFKSETVIPTGLHHGTVSLLLSGKLYEITTFRTDGVYSDNRRPDTVSFVTDLKADLSRRDFTINALAYNPSEGLIDPFSGIKDIERKMIRCVGDADKRFTEDALRIMRALRFSSKLSFEIEPITQEAIKRNRKLLQNIAVERIAVELDGLLIGGNVAEILTGYSEVLEVLIPEITPMIGFEQNNSYHHLDVWKHTVKAVESVPPDRILRLTMLFHDIAKPQCYSETNGGGHFYGHPKVSSEMARKILRRLKYDTRTIKTVTELIYYHDTDIALSEKSVKRWLRKLGEKNLRMLCSAKRADALAKSKERLNSQIEEIETIEKLIDKIIVEESCFSLKDLAITGKDLIDHGIPEGGLIGEVLNELLEMVIDEKSENTREELLKNVTKLLKNEQKLK
ncbi:MAG: CCA tRNA nucleotidyltransferase [Oscillospiraceae bacterium]|nr:CCA tRNA nucleotidyltransferase [Oscillospiraceae bacterium]